MLHISIKHLKKLIVILLVLAVIGLSNCSFVSQNAENPGSGKEIKSFRSETFVNDVKIVIHAEVPVKAENLKEEKIAGIIGNYFVEDNPGKYYRIIVRADYNKGSCVMGNFLK